ncbi:MAG: hypothetical protein AB1758_36360 [Candidatus Eremiobacterota bacterium]
MNPVYKRLDQLENATARLSTQIRFGNYPEAVDAARKLEKLLAELPQDEPQLTEAIEKARNTLARVESIAPTANSQAKNLALKALVAILIASMLVFTYMMLPGIWRLYFLLVALPAVWKLIRMHQTRHW